MWLCRCCGGRGLGRNNLGNKMAYMVAWLSMLRLTTLGGGGRDAAYWSAAGGIKFSVEYRHVPREGEEVGPGNGVWQVGRLGVGREEVRPGSRAGQVEVDKGGTYFPHSFWPIREEEDLIVRWGEGKDPIGVEACFGWQ